MAWIRREDLNGQEVLDEVTVAEAVYVQVGNPQDAIVLLEEENLQKGDEKNGLHSGAKLSK